MKRLACSVFALGLMGASSVAKAQGVDEAAQRPSLVVMIVVDQLSANLFNQYRPYFRGGLRRLAEEGLVHINGYQSHGVTVTCAGHATVLTGLHPASSGIIANDWIDTSTGDEVYCLSAPDYELAHGGDSPNGRVGPGQMQATTLGDWLKAQNPNSRSFAVSGKDRGAITLAGQNGDGAYWFVADYGLTTYVAPGQTAGARLAPVAAFNTALVEHLADVAMGWTYTEDRCRALSGEWPVSDWTFRSDLPPEEFSLGSSPFIDEATLAAAEHLLDGQALGRGDGIDVLGVSLSGTDAVGHTYGTQGPEMCEQLMRLDAALGRFLDRLDDLPGRVVVALTADHGGSDFPERMQAHGNREARRGDGGLAARINATLRDGSAWTPTR